MSSVLKSVRSLVHNIKSVLELAFEIDRRLVTLYYITAFVGGVAPVIAAFILKYIIDKLIVFNSLTDTSAAVFAILILLGGYYLIRMIEIVVYWGLNTAYYDYLLRNRLQNGLMYRFTKKLGSLDLAHLEDSKTQNLIHMVGDSYLWKMPDFVRTWGYVFSNIVGIVSAGFALISFGWWIPFLVILISIPRFYLKLKHGQFVWSMYGSGAPEGKKLWYFSWLLREQSPILETRIFRSQNALLKKMENIQENLYQLNKKPLDNYRWVLVFAPLLESATVFFIVYTFLPAALTGALSVGTLTFLISALENLKSSLAWGAGNVGQLYEHNLFIRPYFKLMSLPSIIRDKQNPHEFAEINPPVIEFRDVSFTYPNGREVLKHVSFRIEPGDTVAIVGSNGAGKSTIIKLMCRFYDVTSGEILINGINLKDVKLSNWYAHLGTLFQDFMKYNFTIRENIMLGNPELKDEKRMHEAARKSGAYEFIKQFPKQFNQMLGKRFEDGEELSGGQWQKLAIARAFYQQAPVLIMDEPTSAIDANAEFEIFNNLETIYKEKILILVSHRFSTVRNANKIIVIDYGRIIEKGHHAELLEQNGKYASMFRAQAKGYQ